MVLQVCINRLKRWIQVFNSFINAIVRRWAGYVWSLSFERWSSLLIHWDVERLWCKSFFIWSLLVICRFLTSTIVWLRCYLKLFRHRVKLPLILSTRKNLIEVLCVLESLGTTFSMIISFKLRHSLLSRLVISRGTRLDGGNGSECWIRCLIINCFAYS